MQSLRHSSAVLFFAVQSALYLLFLYGDLTEAGVWTVWIKYVSILLCLLVSLFWSACGGDKLVTAALAFTLGADTFLLLLNRWYLLGVALFCVVQALYLLRIVREGGGRTRWPVRLGLVLLSLLFLGGTGMLSPLNALSLLYFTTFLCNTLQSWRLPGSRFRLFSAGLTLFLCCDLCVGIFNLPEWSPKMLYSFARMGMWLFYLPAQVLIALSGRPDSDAVR